MAENFVQLPANSTGIKMRTFEQTVGANVVDHQAVVLCDSSGNIIGSLASAPTGTEQGLVTRPASLPAIPAGANEIGRVRVSDGTNLATIQTIGAKNAIDINLGGSTSGTARVTNTFGATPGTITLPNTANVANTTVTVPCPSAGGATFDISAAAYVGSLIFEGSTDGGTTWDTITVAREDGTGVDSNPSLSIASQFQRAWLAGCPGFTHVRVRATAWTSGTATIGITLGAFHTEPSTLALLQTPLAQSIDGTGSPQPFQFAYFNVTTAQTGVSLVAAPAAGRSIRVISYAIVVGAVMNVSLIGTGTTLLFALAANGGVSFAGSLQGPAFQVAAATALTYTTSAAGQATGHICYVVV